MHSLNPCPHCGSETIFIETGTPASVLAQCTYCKIQTQAVSASLEYAAKQRVSEVWNGAAEEEWPIWIMPSGSSDAYPKSAKVSHNGSKWISNIENNVWEPGVSGWTKQ